MTMGLAAREHQSFKLRRGIPLKSDSASPLREILSISGSSLEGLSLNPSKLTSVSDGDARSLRVSVAFQARSAAKSSISLPNGFVVVSCEIEG